VGFRHGVLMLRDKWDSHLLGDTSQKDHDKYMYHTGKVSMTFWSWRMDVRHARRHFWRHIATSLAMSVHLLFCATKDINTSMPFHQPLLSFQITISF